MGRMPVSSTRTERRSNFPLPWRVTALENDLDVHDLTHAALREALEENTRVTRNNTRVMVGALAAVATGAVLAVTAPTLSAIGF
jgi:hypothetical protein